MFKKTQRQERDEKLDELLEVNDQKLQRLLHRVEKTKEIDSDFIRCQTHFKKTKATLETLSEMDLEDSHADTEINGVLK